MIVNMYRISQSCKPSGHRLVFQTFTGRWRLILLRRCFFLKTLKAFLKSLHAQCDIIFGYSNGWRCIEIWARIGICMWHEAMKRVSANSLFNTKWNHSARDLNKQDYQNNVHFAFAREISPSVCVDEDVSAGL